VVQLHVDGMLAAYEAWLAAESLPPLTPWDGVRRAPWDTTQDLALPMTLDGTFAGVSTLVALGAVLRDRLRRRGEYRGLDLTTGSGSLKRPWLASLPPALKCGPDAESTPASRASLAKRTARSSSSPYMEIRT
jgi:hypothetical protein